MDNKTIHVLFIEDNSADVLLLEEKLSDAQHVSWNLPHFEIEHTTRLQAALARLREETFDVVISDLDLPDSRAHETVTNLRTQIPHMPLVVLTGRRDEDLARNSIRAGVQDYLYKDEATGSLLAHTMLYAIERQQIYDDLEQRVEERTTELRVSNAELRREIQKRGVAEARLRDREAELAAIVESVPFAMMVVDRERRVRKINRSGADFVGRPPKEILGIRSGEILRCVHALDDPQGCGFGPFCQICPVRRTLLKTIESGESCQGLEIDMTFTHPEGEEDKTLLLYTTPLTIADETMSLVIFQDITGRKQMEKALRESERRFHSVFDFAPLGINLMDAEGRALQANRALQEMLGYTETEIQKMTFIEYTHPDDVQASLERIHALLEEKGDHLRMEKRYLRKNGGLMWGHVAVSAVRDKENRFQYFVAMVEDITERKQAQQQIERHAAELERTNEALEQFTFTVSHEVPKLAQKVQRSLEQLAKHSERQLDEKGNTYLEHALEHTTRIANIVQARLDSSQR